MAEYKLIENSKGNRWTKDGKFVAEAKVPESEKKLATKQCVFCSQPGTEEKTLNSTRYLLCLEHYNTKTTGELAETIASNAA